MLHKIRIAFLLLYVFIPAQLQARATLTASDLQFVGAFIMPREVGSDFAETAYGAGLALRRVDGQVRLFSGAWKAGDPSLYEVSLPALTTSPPWNQASVVKTWGHVFTNRDGYLTGLFWDDEDKRLYYSSSWSYVASGDQYRPTLGFLTISADETTTTSYGRWGFENRSFKQTNFGVTSIPSDFASQYLGGKRLAAGFGGYQSVAAFGPVSFGPSLTAFDPPAIGSEGSYVDNTPLVGYGGSDGSWTTGSRPAVNRAWRDDDVIHDIYGNLSDPDQSTANVSQSWRLSGDESFYWQGYSVNGNSRSYIPDYLTFDNSRIVTKHWVPGNAFWNTDYLFQSGTWIQTANKEGILFLGTFDTSHVWYYSSNSHAEGMKHKWLVYSRDQLADVVEGVVREDEIQPTRYDTNLSDLGISSRAHSGIPDYSCTGMVFDPIDNKLYVALQYASNAPTKDLYSRHLIVVYSINDALPLTAKISPGQARHTAGTGRFVQ